VGKKQTIPFLNQMEIPGPKGTFLILLAQIDADIHQDAAENLCCCLQVLPPATFSQELQQS